MSSLVVLPILIPALTFATCVIAWRAPRVQQTLGVSGALLHLLSAAALLSEVLDRGVVVARIGAWPAPFGISLVADTLGAAMALVTGVIALATAIYSIADTGEAGIRRGHFALLHVLIMGVSGAFLTGDLFNLFVFFEVMLMASFVLLSKGGRPAQLEGALKYVTLNLLSSFFFLISIGLLYAVARTLNMADLARTLPEVARDHEGVVLGAGALLVVSFGIKAGVFPLCFWLPASYHVPPTAVSALLAGLLTKVGVYALVRATTLILPLPAMLFLVISVVAGATMLVGVLGAVSQFDIRRILGFHIISQIGYIIVGIGLLGVADPATRSLALAATVFYVIHHILVKANLYLIGGIIARLRGSFDLRAIGGLARHSPWLAVLFLVPALSLAGIPPLSGFWAKLGIIQAGIAAGAPVLVFVAILCGVLTLISMLKIWNEAFWKPIPEDTVLPPPLTRRTLTFLVAPSVLLALGTLAIGLWPEPLFQLADRAAAQIVAPDVYVRAVLGSGQ
jgi:multicomponent Na+:H+ antiporter subunit D